MKSDQDFFDVFGSDDKNHSNPVIKNAEHLLLGNLPFLFQKREDGRNIPGPFLDNRFTALGDDSRKVSRNPPSCDMGNSNDIEISCEVEDRLDIDACRPE